MALKLSNRFKIIVLVAFAVVVALGVNYYQNHKEKSRTPDLIEQVDDSGEEMVCWTFDKNAKFTFNKNSEKGIALEYRDAKAVDGTTNIPVKRVGGSSRHNETSFGLSNGISGKIANLQKEDKSCHDPAYDKDYPFGLEIKDWGDLSEGGFNQSGCCSYTGALE